MSFHPSRKESRPRIRYQSTNFHTAPFHLLITFVTAKSIYVQARYDNEDFMAVESFSNVKIGRAERLVREGLGPFKNLRVARCGTEVKGSLRCNFSVDFRGMPTVIGACVDMNILDLRCEKWKAIGLLYTIRNCASVLPVLTYVTVEDSDVRKSALLCFER